MNRDTRAAKFTELVRNYNKLYGKYWDKNPFIASNFKLDVAAIEEEIKTKTR